MRFLILGRALGLKKKTIISILGIGGLVPRHQSFGARKTTRREPKINIAEKLADVVAKLRQRGKKDQPPKLLCDIKMAEKRRYNFFFFFWKMPKIWVGRTTRNGEKKGDVLMMNCQCNGLHSRLTQCCTQFKSPGIQ